MNNDQLMNVWKNIILNFLMQKYEDEIVKYLKEKFKKIADDYAKEKFYHNGDIAFILDSKKNKKADGQKESDFIVEQIFKLSEFSTVPTSINFVELQSEINLKKQEALNKFTPQVWLSWAAENAKSVTFATHVSKLTHSAIDSPSFFYSKRGVKNSYLTTSNLNSAAVDGAVRGNQFSPIYQFLELEQNGKKIISEFNDIETDILVCFSKNDDQKKQWNKGFNSALSEGKPAAHSLLKQIYFPIETKKYHLLTNIVSSSKAQAIFEFSRRNEDATFKLRNDQKYSNNIYFNFPNKASILITASNHGNASQLNGKRGGRLGLFSCQPPIWNSTLKPPIYKKSFFFELLRSYQVKEIIQYLSEFLMRFESLQLSIKHPKRMRWLEQWIEDLVDEIIMYVKTIQSIPIGWSLTEGIKLKPEHQVLLDYGRQDEEFLLLKNEDWQTVVIQDFSNWLNYCLHKENEKFTPQEVHSKLWRKLFEKNFMEIFEMPYINKLEKI